VADAGFEEGGFIRSAHARAKISEATPTFAWLHPFRGPLFTESAGPSLGLPIGGHELMSK
jgi:hypothetical protein